MMAIAVVEGLVVLLLAVLVVGLLRSHADILRRLHALDGGEVIDDPAPASQLVQITPRGGDATGGTAPDLTGITLADETVEIGLAGAAYDTVLAFLSSTCYTCEPFWNELAAGAQAPAGSRVVVVVQDGDSVARLRKLAGSSLVVVRSDSAWTDYQVPGSPHFIYVEGKSGRVIGEGTASTWTQIVDLLSQAHQSVATDGTDAAYPDPEGRDNPSRIDAELLAAGIGPGHASLYPETSGPGDSAPTV